MNDLAVIPSLELAIAQSLADHAQSARDAYAPATVRAIRDDCLKFSQWCADQGLNPMPADPRTVAGFIDAQAELSRKPASIRRYASSISHFHRAAGVPNPCESLVTKMALRRMARTLGTAQKQAAPLNRPQVDRIIATAGDTLRARRDVALLSVGYDTLCRRSELVAFNVEDVEFGAMDATVIVRRSKTDQIGAGVTKYLAPDTVRYLRAWIEAAGITEGPLFRAVRGARVGGRLTGADVARILCELSARAGLDVRATGHSLRIGCAQDMTSAGLSLPEIMVAGSWTSPQMPAQYSAKLSVRRGAAAKLYALQDR